MDYLFTLELAARYHAMHQEIYVFYDQRFMYNVCIVHTGPRAILAVSVISRSWGHVQSDIFYLSSIGCMYLRFLWVIVSFSALCSCTVWGIFLKPADQFYKVHQKPYRQYTLCTILSAVHWPVPTDVLTRLWCCGKRSENQLSSRLPVMRDQKKCTVHHFWSRSCQFQPPPKKGCNLHQKKKKKKIIYPVPIGICVIK